MPVTILAPAVTLRSDPKINDNANNIITPTDTGWKIFRQNVSSKRLTS